MKIVILNAPENQLKEFLIEKPVVAIGFDKEWADFFWFWDGSLSRQHARLLYEKDGYWLEDVGSTNGTIIDGEKIDRKTELKKDVEFQLGTTRLRLEADERPHPKTQIVYTTGEKIPPSNLNVSRHEPQRPAEVEAQVVSPRVKIVVLLDNYPEHPFEISPITIGRAEGNALRLHKHQVSREHAQLTFENEQWHLMDLGSTNGTFLNDTRLQPKKPVLLPIGSTFNIAKLIDLKFDHGLPPPFESQVAFIHAAFVPHLATEGLLAQLKSAEDEVVLLKERLAFPKWIDQIVTAYSLCATKYKAQEDFVDWLCETLSADDEEIRANAADSLGLIGDKRAIDSLELLLCDKEKLVRARTALALGMLKAEQTDSKLFYLLEHDDSRSVQRAAALALTYISERTRSELRQALREGDYPTKLRQLIERFPSSTECVEGQLPTYFDSASPEE